MSRRETRLTCLSCGKLFADNTTVTVLLSVLGYPVLVRDFNVWHRVPEPKARVSTERWKKYGKYELQGRTKALSEAGGGI